ncbi:MAG TPA: recombinase RecT [Anaerolineae bacterium]|nr:recombinase RecT [Phycisphaerae bacterium]HUW13850.1 recombinase RecT [Anaerolineae bacterium]
MSSTEMMVKEAQPMARVSVDLEERRFEWDKLKMQAQIVLESGLAPDSLDSESAILAVMLAGRELKVPPMLSLREFYIVHGHVSMSAKLMKALVSQSGKGRFEFVESTDKVCILRGVRTDVNPPEVVETKWTLDRVPAANKSKDNWRNYPTEMLRNRAIAELARTLWPDVTGGMYAPEELDGADADGFGHSPKVERGTLSMKDMKAAEFQEKKDEPPSPAAQAPAQAEEPPAEPEAPQGSSAQNIRAGRVADNEKMERELVVGEVSRALHEKGLDPAMSAPARQLVRTGTITSIEELIEWLKVTPEDEALKVKGMGPKTYAHLCEVLLGDQSAEPAEPEQPLLMVEILKDEDQQLSDKGEYTSIAHVVGEKRTGIIWLHVNGGLACGCNDYQENGACRHMDLYMATVAK